MYTVEIYNSSLQLQAICENHQSVEWTRKFRGLGTFEMVINENMPEAQYIAKGGHIVIRKGGDFEAGGIIDYVAKNIDESGYAGEEIIVKGNTLDGILSRRICLPPYGSAYYEDTDAAESVIKALVAANVITPEDGNRTIANFVNATDGATGETIAIQARYNSLADKIIEACNMTANIGFEVTLNASGEYEFDIITGVDRSKGNGVVTEVILDPAMDNVKTMQLEDSDVGRVTLGYIAGQGEGADREIYRTGYDDLDDTQSGADFVSQSAIVANVESVGDVAQIKSYPAIHFDKTTGYVNFPAVGLNPASFSIGVLLTPGVDNADLADNEQMIVDMRGEYNVFISYVESTDSTNPNTIRCWMNTAGGAKQAFVPCVVGTPIFITMDYDGTNLRVYNSSIQFGSPISSGSPTAATLATNRLGKDATATNRLWFTGNIAELQIWNTSRTFFQIEAEMPALSGEHSIDGSEAGLLLCYLIDEGRGVQLNDDSGNNKHGTLNAGVYWIAPKYDIIYTHYLWQVYALPDTGDIGDTVIEWEAHEPVASDNYVTIVSALNNAIGDASVVEVTGNIFVSGSNKKQGIFDLTIGGANEKFLFEITAANKFRIGGRTLTTESLQYQDSAENVPFMQWIEFAAKLDLVKKETTLIINGEEFTMSGTMVFARTTFPGNVSGNVPRIARTLDGLKSDFKLYRNGTVIAHWPMDEGTGTVIADVVGNYTGATPATVVWYKTSVTVKTNVTGAEYDATNGGAIPDLAIGSPAPGGFVQIVVIFATEHVGFTPSLESMSLFVISTDEQGLSRREFFQDARDLDTTAKLADRGEATIDAQGDAIKFEAEITPADVTTAFTYRDDWDLGDIITLVNSRWGIEQDKAIVEITGRLEAKDVEASISAKLGASWRSLSDIIKNELANSEVSLRE